ncbi:MAG TPA: hypothetical protein VJL80_13065 [Aeromicrobium sp.]|nr:hypothetical protein [Aeromicrobium sp.]HKY58964.1 hypothetical protein [Aeromicrobium sp.]
MAAKAKVISMPKREEKPPKVDPNTPWGSLGFLTERDMLLDDLKTLDRRIKSETTTATAVAALSKRKHEIFDQIKQLDAGDDPDDILDDSDDEAWTTGG